MFSFPVAITVYQCRLAVTFQDVFLENLLLFESSWRFPVVILLPLLQGFVHDDQVRRVHVLLLGHSFQILG